jgi:predicted lipid-binding transport protein (Tim44 family)
MKNITAFLFTLVMTLGLSLSVVSDVEAKRFGSGGSFGSKRSYSTPYKRSTTTTPSRSASQQQAYQKNQAARNNLSRRGGLMGLLGGLALGGLLGALFFGGAFEGFNFMDLLVFGGIAFLLYKLFAAKTARQAPNTYARNSYDYESSYSDSTDNSRNSRYSGSSNAGFDTDILFNKKNQNTFSSADASDASFAMDIPAGFDTEDFLNGAKGAFRQLQSAWDRRDLAEIRSLTTDKVFGEIQDQLRAMEGQNITEVLNLDAQLLDIREIGSELEAVVLFDALIREEANAQAEPVREVWHFTKSRSARQPKWYLDGLQQLED